MKRRRLLVVALVGATAGPSPAYAQPRAAPPRIGYLSMMPPGGDASWVAAFRGGLRELGYIEGRTILVDERHAAQQPDRVRTLLAELLALKVRVIVTFGTHHIAKDLAGTTPIVFAIDPDPVGTGIVASLARPGGNITGLSDAHADLAPKRLTLLKEVVPGLARVAVLYNPQVPHAVRQLRAVEAIAPSLGLAIIARGVEHYSQIEAALAALAAATQLGALLTIPDPTWLGSAGRLILAEEAQRHRLPAIGTVRENAEAGVLLAYGTNFHDLWRRAAAYVDKILKGASPADLPIEQPTKFEFVVNLKTARALGLAIPPAILARADEVIE